MFSKRLAAPALALLFLAGCGRSPAKPPIERIAVLRFENLSADASADWIGRALAEVISSEMQTLPNVYAISSERLHSLDIRLGRVALSAPGISGERNLALAAGATRIGYGQYVQRDGALEARLTLEDVATRRMAVAISARSAADDVIAVASSLAQQISGRTVRPPAENTAALKAYIEGIEIAGVPAAAPFERAIAADPDFAPAYRSLAQIATRQNDIPGAVALLQRALARPSISDPERTRLQLEAAVLSGNLNARVQALAALTRITPADPLVWRDLGAITLSRRDYRPAVEAYRKSLEIEPEDANSWNQLGYAEAYAGDLQAGIAALRRYQTLAPASPNPLDSLGDVNLLWGKLRDAEGFYLEGAKKDPNFYAGVDFLKAAMAHLMTGDVAGADAIANRYFDARTTAKDPLVDYRRAQWSWISGRRKTGYQQMQAVARNAENSPLREVAAHAWAELAIWDVLLGNRPAAAENARKAASLAGPASATAVALATFFAQPPASPAEWAARANRMAPNPAQAPLRSAALADALLLDKDFHAALPVLQQVSEGPDEGFPVVQAWALLETGHTAEALGLLRFNPILATSGIGALTPFYFPRLFYLRGLAAQRQGKADEARAQFNIFRQLSGPDALVWGEEKAAP